jgi:TrmH family RNA methyltransferase
MLSKNKKKFLTSLQQKKYRKKYNAFIVEGHKINFDLLTEKIKCFEVYASVEWIGETSELLPENVIAADI